MHVSSFSRARREGPIGSLFSLVSCQSTALSACQRVPLVNDALPLALASSVRVLVAAAARCASRYVPGWWLVWLLFSLVCVGVLVFMRVQLDCATKASRTPVLPRLHTCVLRASICARTCGHHVMALPGSALRSQVRGGCLARASVAHCNRGTCAIPWASPLFLFFLLHAERGSPCFRGQL